MFSSIIAANRVNLSYASTLLITVSVLLNLIIMGYFREENIFEMLEKNIKEDDKIRYKGPFKYYVSTVGGRGVLVCLFLTCSMKYF